MTLLGTREYSSEQAIHVPRNSTFTCVSPHALSAIGDTENKLRAYSCSSGHHISHLAATPQRQHERMFHLLATPRRSGSEDLLAIGFGISALVDR